MRGGAKADGSALGGVLCGALATRGVSTGAVTAAGGATSDILTVSSGTPATCSGILAASSGAQAASSNAQAVSSDGMAATGKEAVPAVVLTDEAEEHGSEERHLTDGKDAFYTLWRDTTVRMGVGSRHRRVRAGGYRTAVGQGEISPNYICN